MKSDLEYYMGLRYLIELVPISERDGGGWVARITQLGQYLFVGRGETILEVLDSLERIKKILFEHYIKNGVEIDEPKQI